MTIQHPDCNQSNGSITGIVVTSTGTKLFYTWRDAENNIVGRAADLKGVPSGVYVLEVSDNSGCGSSVFSPKIFVGDINGITIDYSAAVIKDESCDSNGAIEGIVVQGATNFEWHNTITGAVVSTSTVSADLIGVRAGSFQLYASNSTCQLKSKTFAVSHGILVPLVVDSVKVNPTCAGELGSLTVSLFVQKGTPKLKIFLADTSGAHISDGLILGDNGSPVLKYTQLLGGLYNLFVQDDNNCTIFLSSFTLKTGIIEVDYKNSIVVNDKCNQHLGAITPAYTGVTPPRPAAHFTWTDISTGKVVGNSKTLIRVGAGTYQLKIVDPIKSSCVGYGTFTVSNVSPSLVPPKAAGTTICLPGMINISITNADTAGTFKLYASATDSVALAENRTGVFYRQVSKTTDFYITRRHADCESDRTKVTETVVAEINIPNTFTPNNDGINDTWNLTGIEKFPGADISVFTRGGQLIFHSVNYPVPFSGNYNGSQLPAGVYYYVLDVKQPICFGKITGSLTIIR
ncbi:MAG: hypothetical protein NVSMB24_14870 [Mucilaginibacter sp.]